jgi:hypothetical protein
VFAPEAVRVAELPGHIVIELTDTVGVGLIVTVEVAVVVHPPVDVALIVYTVVEAGFAVTTLPVVALRPVAGLQV